MQWPHAPIHQISEAGTYIVTAGTYRKEHFFGNPERLSLLTEALISLAAQYEWKLQGWAVFSNHYHYVADSPGAAASLPTMIGHLHTVTATTINKMDGQPGRKVWFQYWDTRLTYEKSFLARLSYVHLNAVKHGLVEVASQYQWCSARWFEQQADPVFCRRVLAMKTDTVNVRDDYDPASSHIRR